MAQRDRSQGFGFVYVDVAKLLANRQEWQKEGSPILPGEDTQVVNFNKDPEAPKAEAAPATPAEDRSTAVHQIRQNLDRLQSLHHKLHAMLEELNHLTGQKKKA